MSWIQRLHELVANPDYKEQNDSNLQMDWTEAVVPPRGVPPWWVLASLHIMVDASDLLEIPRLVKPDEWVELLAPRMVTKTVLKQRSSCWKELH